MDAYALSLFSAQRCGRRHGRGGKAESMEEECPGFSPGTGRLSTVGNLKS